MSRCDAARRNNRSAFKSSAEQSLPNRVRWGYGKEGIERCMAKGIYRGLSEELAGI